MRRKQLAVLALVGYFVSLLLFQSRLTWENFYRQTHIVETPRPPFTLGRNLVLDGIRPEARDGGLQAGDLLLAIDGAAARGERSPQAVVDLHKAGEVILVTVERGGAPITRPVVLQPISARALTVTQWILFAFLDVLTPWFCLILGFVVVFQRLLDPLAWLLLMLLMSFGGVAQAGNVVAIVSGWEVPTRPLAILYYLTITNSWGFWMLLFGQFFPDRTAGGRWARVVNWMISAPLACYALLWGVSNALAIEDGRTIGFEIAVQRWSRLDLWLAILAIGIFFERIFRKMLQAPNPDARRRLQLLAVGAALSLTPVVMLALAALLSTGSLTAFVAFSPWLWIPALLLLFLFPVTLAYVIVVRRAMEVNVALRQGLQYALARGGARMMMWSVVVVLVIYSIRMAYEPGTLRSQLLLVLLASAASLFVLRLASARLYSWIDRHFFREAVNTERVLGDLAQTVRTIVGAEALLKTVTETISSTLHVNRVAALVRENGLLVPGYAVGFGTEVPPVRLSVQSPLGERLSRDGQPLRSAIAALKSDSPQDAAVLKALSAELVLPVSANGHLVGVLTLGPKRSEAPYSPSDIRLLESLAVQTGLTLENSRLTAEMAREIARRESMARELEIAREVQQRLLPQFASAVENLDYTGLCRPAATVGGDYYDFLRIPERRVGFAVGDVSGKGIPAALLMASLRASLHALAVAYSSATAELMANLNRLIYEASSPERYATFFYGLFDPEGCTFTYVNAGHNAPMLLRSNTGEVVRLEEGGLMIGALPCAEYRQGRVLLTPGDAILMFTDGVTEATNVNGDEFGEERLKQTLIETAAAGSEKVVKEVLAAVDSFTDGAPQADDITVLALRVLE